MRPYDVRQPIRCLTGGGAEVRRFDNPHIVIVCTCLDQFVADMARTDINFSGQEFVEEKWISLMKSFFCYISVAFAKHAVSWNKKDRNPQASGLFTSV